MAALTTVAIIAGLAIAAGTAGAEYDQTRQASREAKDAGRDQENAALGVMAEAETQQKQTDAQQQAVASRSRQRSLAAAQSGGGSTYGGTLKTSPLGVTSPLQTAQKSLLGL